MLLVFAQKGQWLAGLFRTAYHMVSSQCHQRHDFIPSQVLDLTFPFGELAEFLVISFPQPVEVSLMVPLMAANPCAVSATLPVLYCVKTS